MTTDCCEETWPTLATITAALQGDLSTVVAPMAGSPALLARVAVNPVAEEAITRGLTGGERCGHADLGGGVRVPVIADPSVHLTAFELRVTFLRQE